jgi:hypothetical protein
MAILRQHGKYKCNNFNNINSCFGLAQYGRNMQHFLIFISEYKRATVNEAALKTEVNVYNS